MTKCAYCEHHNCMNCDVQENERIYSESWTENYECEFDPFDPILEEDLIEEFYTNN